MLEIPSVFFLFQFELFDHKHVNLKRIDVSCIINKSLRFVWHCKRKHFPTILIFIRQHCQQKEHQNFYRLNQSASNKTNQISKTTHVRHINVSHFFFLLLKDKLFFHSPNPTRNWSMNMIVVHDQCLRSKVLMDVGRLV